VKSQIWREHARLPGYALAAGYNWLSFWLKMVCPNHGYSTKIAKSCAFAFIEQTSDEHFPDLGVDQNQAECLLLLPPNCPRSSRVKLNGF
jgi:hypothetical protein